MDEDAFLQAIIEAPDDEGLRLVYADWLEEQGRPERAEFIRVQCRLARLPARHPQRARLREREKKLLAEGQQEWLGQLHGLTGQWEFRDGFPEKAIIAADNLLKHADALFGRLPLRELFINDIRKRHTPQLLRLPYLSRLRWLRLGAAGLGRERSAELVGGLVSSPSVAGLQELHLDCCPIGVNGVQSLVASPHLRLRVLNLQMNRLGNEGGQILASWPGLTTLEVLHLQLSSLGDAGLAALAASPYLGHLTELLLPYNQLGNTGAAALAACPRLAGLGILDLHYNQIGAAGASALAASPHLADLKILRLNNNNIRAEGARALAESPYLKGITELAVFANYLQDESKALLKKRFGRRVNF
jgi:uncharacterized protein (TIGR02996 family)